RARPPGPRPGRDDRSREPDTGPPRPTARRRPALRPRHRAGTVESQPARGAAHRQPDQDHDRPARGRADLSTRSPEDHPYRPPLLGLGCRRTPPRSPRAHQRAASRTVARIGQRRGDSPGRPRRRLGATLRRGHEPARAGARPAVHALLLGLRPREGRPLVCRRSGRAGPRGPRAAADRSDRAPSRGRGAFPDPRREALPEHHEPAPAPAVPGDDRSQDRLHPARGPHVRGRGAPARSHPRRGAARLAGPECAGQADLRSCVRRGQAPRLSGRTAARAL
ncbi:MAG: D-alanyl-D-alanine carboxypeptidase, partial [uncultured Gemmatimonadaceae bacterium]